MKILFTMQLSDFAKQKLKLEEIYEVKSCSDLFSNAIVFTELFWHKINFHADF